MSGISALKMPWFRGVIWLALWKIKDGLDIPGLEQRVTERTPAGRWGDPDDLGGISVFLASEASNYITGTAIPVDGGYSING